MSTTEPGIAIRPDVAPANARHAEMLALNRAHGEAEMTLDLDLVMATMTADCWLEFVPLGIRCEGAPAVRELYSRVLPVIIPSVEEAREKSAAFGDDHVVLEHDVILRLPGGERHAGPLISVFFFRDRLMSGQRSYVDPVWTRLWEQAIGEGFDRFPGVTVSRGGPVRS